MASLVLGGVGALIGSSFGGPAGARMGFMIGSAIGGLIDQANAPKPDIGKLTDLKYSGSAYGADIPRIWGKARVAGNVIWAAEDANGNHLVQHKKSAGGGKGGGGGGATQYWYSATFAVAFAQGAMFMPDPSQSDGGDLVTRNLTLKRLWADDTLVYDSSAGSNLVTPTFYAGSESQSPDSLIIAAEGTSSGDTPAYRGLCYIVIEDMDLRKFSNHVPNFSAELETDAVTVGDIFSDLARMGGVLSSELDVTAATDSVTGFVELNQTSPQASMAALLTAYAYDAVEVDGKIKLVARGGSVAATVSANELGMSEDSQAPTVTRTRRLITELPSRVTVQFMDSGNSYQQATETEVRHGTRFQNTLTIYLPMSLTGTQARNIAARILDTLWAEVEDYEFSLGPKYLKYCPGDILNLPLNTGTVRARITSMTMAPLGRIEVKAVLDASNVVSQSTPGNGSSTPPDTYTPVPAVFDAWSGTEIRDEDRETAGFYVAAAPDPAEVGQWTGGVVWYSLDGGTSYLQGPNVLGICNFGETTSTLSASGAVADTWDYTNDVDIDLSVMQGELESKTEDQVLGGENHALVGVEILGFQTPSLTSAYNYTLSDLRRGERGSVMSGHATGERFVELTNDIVRVNVPDSYVGTTVKVKVLTEFQVLGDVTAVDVVIVARTPTDIERLRDGLLLRRPVTPILIDSYDGATATRTAVSWTTIATAVTATHPNAVQVDVYGQGDDGGDTAARMKIWVRQESGEAEIPVCEAKINGSDEDAHPSGTTGITLDADGKFQYKVDTGFRDGWSIYVTHVWEPIPQY